MIAYSKEKCHLLSAYCVSGTVLKFIDELYYAIEFSCYLSGITGMPDLLMRKHRPRGAKHFFHNHLASNNRSNDRLLLNAYCVI